MHAGRARHHIQPVHPGGAGPLDQYHLGDSYPRGTCPLEDTVPHPLVHQKQLSCLLLLSSATR